MVGQPQFSTDHFALKLGLFYAAYFLFGGIQLPFFPLWLEARGLDARAIGVVLAVPMFARVFVTPIIAQAADRYRALKAVLVVASACGAAAMVVVGLVEGFVAILVTFALAAIAFSPILSLTDAYAVNGLRVRGRAYGPVRLWGSVTFIVGNVGAGFLLEAIAPGHLIWLLVGSLMLVVVSAASLVPVDRIEPAPAATAAPSQSLWRNPVFLLVAAASSLTQSSHAFFYGFSTLDWRAAGFSGQVIGVLWAIGVVAEIVLFALSARLPAALGPIVMIAVGAAGALLRWTVMAFDPPLALLPILQILHAASFCATHLGAMAFLLRAVPREFSARAQAVVATTGGILTAAATGLSGLIYAASGSLAYLAMSAMALAGLVCALIAQRLWRHSSES